MEGDTSFNCGVAPESKQGTIKIRIDLEESRRLSGDIKSPFKCRNAMACMMPKCGQLCDRLVTRVPPGAEASG